MKTIKRDIVGVFIFSSDNKLLLGQTISGGVYESSWVVPGGGIEDGESKLQAVIRKTKEEVGIDISTAQIDEIAGVSTGQSEKTLRDTGERVLVDMNFFDFKVVLPTTSTETPPKPEDDLSKAQWFTRDELSSIELGTPTKKHSLRLVS